MTDELTFAGYPVFKVDREKLAQHPPAAVAKELDELLNAWSERVETRGVYSTAGFRADADLMFWWVTRSVDDIQNLLIDLRRTVLGSALYDREMFLGLVREAEFARDHLPAFVQGKAPLKYMCVYPFVRTPEWYLLDPSERGGLLREHGQAGREFPDVNANTTSAFGLSDYEWILAFEAASVDRIVDLIRRLRGTEARRYTKVEIPFFTGIRKAPADAVADLF